MMNITNRRQKRFIKKEEEKKFLAKYKRFDCPRKANVSKYAADYINLLQENNGIQYSNTKESKKIEVTSF